jgi:hypothetical protein
MFSYKLFVIFSSPTKNLLMDQLGMCGVSVNTESADTYVTDTAHVNMRRKNARVQTRFAVKSRVDAAKNHF